MNKEVCISCYGGYILNKMKNQCVDPYTYFKNQGGAFFDKIMSSSNPKKVFKKFQILIEPFEFTNMHSINITEIEANYNNDSS